MTKALELAGRTHEVCIKLRTTSVALADFIPHIQAMADELRRLAAVEQELADLKAAMGEPVAWIPKTWTERYVSGVGAVTCNLRPTDGWEPLYTIKAAK